MQLSKIDLSNLVAIGHSNGNLELLIDRGNAIELIEIPAPEAAYQGLQLVGAIVENSFAAIEAQIQPIAQPIAMLPVDSSVATSVGYDRDRETLQIEFNNGAVYQYSDVDEDTWTDLLEADSLGEFYNMEIKGFYESSRLDDDDF